MFSGSYMLLAQQMPHFTQYLLNDYVINPAIGGSKNYFESKLNHREQWVGITDAPRTNVLSLHGPLENKKMGVGGYLFSDVLGPTRLSGARLSYSYHLQVTQDYKVSLGLSGGVLQYLIDGAKISTQETGDIALSSGVQSVYVPDAGFGVYLYSDNLFFSISAPQIIPVKLQFFENYKETQSKLVNHYYVMGGYRFDINNDITIEPSFLVKYVVPVPPQFEVSARAFYKRNIWVSSTFRSQDAINFALGYSFQNNILVGYSYDYTTSNLRNYSSGTHEVMLGVRFKHRKKVLKTTSENEE